MYTVRVVTQPSTEPLSVVEAKDYLRLDTTADDALVGSLIEAATEMAENYLRRALITQSLELTIDRFRDPMQAFDPYGFNVTTPTIQLPRPPLQQVTKIEYFDSDDTLQTVTPSTYATDTRSEPGLVFLANGASWPSDLRRVAAVRITYDAGYGDKRESVPKSIRTAMLRLVSHLYDNRDDKESGGLSDFPFTVKAILSKHRSMWP